MKQTKNIFSLNNKTKKLLHETNKENYLKFMKQRKLLKVHETKKIILEVHETNKENYLKFMKQTNTIT